MQTTFQNSFTRSFSGQLADTYDHDILSGVIADVETAGVNFGRALVYGSTDGKQYRLPMNNNPVVTFSAALTTSNQVSFSVAANGANAESITPITYATSESATMNALKTAIEALTGVALVTVNTSNHSLTITADPNTDLVITCTVTGGTPPTVTKTNGSSDSIVGFSAHRYMQPVGNASNAEIVLNAKDSVDVAHKTRIWVYCEDAFDVTNSVYMRFVDESGDYQKRGMLKTSTTNDSSVVVATATPAKFLNSGSAGSLALIELNNP